MKRKIVMKVCLSCDKCWTKAMELVAIADGLISVAIAGDEKLEVVGDGIDHIRLLSRLRKLCYAEILMVEEVKDKKPEEKTPELVDPPPYYYPGYYYYHQHHHQPTPWW